MLNNKSKKILYVQHLQKRFKEMCVLNDIHFSVTSGTIFVLLGSNGAGKTTLFKRNLLLSSRSLDTLFNNILTPVVLMLLFVYVFGGAIQVDSISYIDFVVPGVLIQCITQSASLVGVVVNQDLKTRMAERLLTLNISKSAF